MLLTVKALSQRLQITPSTLYAWANQGKIPSRKIHGLVRFDPTDIDRWLASFSPPQPLPTKIQAHSVDHTDLTDCERKTRGLYFRLRGNHNTESHWKGVNGWDS